MSKSKTSRIIVALKKLVSKKNYILHDDIYEQFSEDFDIDAVDVVYSRIAELGIEVFDSEEEAKTKLRAQEARAKKLNEKMSQAAAQSMRYDDPVRMYLREMGKVPLLDREGEIAIAKRIEAGKHQVLEALFRSPFSEAHVDQWVEALANGTLSVEDLIQVDTGGYQEHHTPQKRDKATAVRTLRRLRKLGEEILACEEKLARADTERKKQAAEKALQTRRESWLELLHGLSLQPKRVDELVLALREVHDEFQAAAKQVHHYEKFLGMDYDGLRETIARMKDRGWKNIQLRGKGRWTLTALEDLRRKQYGLHPQPQDPGEGARRHPRATRGAAHPRRAGGAPRRAGQEGDDRGQRAPGDLHRQALHEPRPRVPGPDPGGQRRPDARRRQVRLPQGLQVLHLRAPGGSGRRSRAPSPTRRAPSACPCT